MGINGIYGSKAGVIPNLDGIFQVPLLKDMLDKDIIRSSNSPILFVKSKDNSTRFVRLPFSL